MAKQRASHAKRDEFVRQHRGNRLLGEVISWSLSNGAARKHHEVVDALKASGLDESVAREILPRHAFTRAMRQMKDDRVIDELDRDPDNITFQFTRRFLDAGEWKYKKETLLKLNTTTGKVSCPDNDLQSAAQRLLDQAIEERTTADITKMIQRVFDANGDLFPIRDQGGVYFVPNAHSGLTDHVEQFVHTIHGRILRFPVPANTRQGDQATQDAVAGGLAAMISDHEAAVEKFGLDTRADTLEKAAERIKATRVKIEAYASYLADKRDDLLKAVEVANKQLVAKVKELSEERAKAPAVQEQDGKARVHIFGHSCVAVIRWFGVDGWKFKQARRVLSKLVGNGYIKDATIRIQLGKGKSGAAEPAELTPEQQQHLRGMRKPSKKSKDSDE